MCVLRRIFQGLGLAAGPIQPINAELAVDVTYPSDETAVESVQQIGGNMISALLIPVAEWASERIDWEILPNIPQLAGDIRGDVVLLLFVALLTMAFYQTFDAPLARSFADTKNDTEPSLMFDEKAAGVHVTMEPLSQSTTEVVS